MQHSDLSAAIRRLYPWPGRDLVLKSGHRLHYLDEGPQDQKARETVLMVHGNPTWSFYWRNLVTALSGQYRCVVPDHIGCGLSDKPQDWPYRLEGHIHNLEQLVLALDLRDITLVVHDWGGAIGLGVAQKHPERFGRIVVFNSAVFEAQIPLNIRMCRWPWLGAWMVRVWNGFLLTAMVVGFAKPTVPGAKSGYLAPYKGWDNRVAILRFVQDIPIEADHPTRPVMEAMDRGMAGLRHLPALIVWGERDTVFTLEFLRGWTTRLPQAEVRRFPDAAHFVVEDLADQIPAMLADFFARNPAAASHEPR